MRMNGNVFLMASLALAMCLTGSAADTHATAGEATLSTGKLVTTMRLLNTGQVSYRNENHRFADLAELVAFLHQKNMLAKSPLNLENPAPYQVHVTTNPNATHYQIAIQPPTDACRTAAFSDDGGIIYLGQAIDCPAAPH